MNTALRIASITYVLRHLLIDGLNYYNNLPNHPDVSGADVTAKCPDRIDTSGDTEKSQLNLFMYQATLNQGWKNTGFPTFNSAGNRISNSPLGIDLHYLLTAYGSEDLHTDILLGYGMQLLHENPILTRKYISTALQAPAPLSTHVQYISL